MIIFAKIEHFTNKKSGGGFLATTALVNLSIRLFLTGFLLLKLIFSYEIQELSKNYHLFVEGH